MSAQPKPFMRSPVITMATNMSHMVAFADAIPIWAIVSTLSAKSWRYLAQSRLSVENRLGSEDFEPTQQQDQGDDHARQRGPRIPRGDAPVWGTCLPGG